MNYQTAQNKLAGARDKSRGKPLANNTRLVEVDGGIAVRLHQTNVITFRPDGSVVLDSGGWQTVTTKARINDYAPCRVYQNRGQWTVVYAGRSYAFVDGMILKPDGTVEGSPPHTPQLDKAARAKRAAVNRYAKAFTDALVRGEIAAPSGGDCWHCAFREVKSGKPLGEIARDASHVESHIEESYFVPSLLYNAVATFADSYAAKAAVHEWTHPGANVGGWSQAPWVVATVRKAIRRYCLRQLGMPA